MARYIKCPRCELNYIDEEKQEYCDICLVEMRGMNYDSVDLLEDEEEEMDVCPCCGENMKPLSEPMCEECKRKRDAEPEEDVDPDKDDSEWGDFVEKGDDTDLAIGDEEFDEDEEEEDDLYHGPDEEDDLDYVTVDEAMGELGDEDEEEEEDLDDDF
ncbi:MAG: hypothetical protein ACI4U2_01515 [Christensenellaceae bacterium]